MAQSDVYFRPEWTVGRYNKQKAAAIFFNLIEGISYYFEDDSAAVIGGIISAGRNGKVSVARLAEETEISLDELRPFLEELLQLGLLTTTVPTPEGITEYRRKLAEWKKENPVKLDRSTREKLPMDVSNAERAYAERCGGVTSVMIELTYNCSEKCIHCYNVGATRNDSEKSHRGDLLELSLEDYKRIIDELYAEGLFMVCLSGGDPFSKPFAWEIINYLYEKEIAFDIYTNGQRLVDSVERLASFYPRVVGVSIYSSDPEVHDYITRIPGSWERSMKVVRQLGELSVPMNLKCCVMRPNFKSYRGVAAIARSVGAEPQFEINVSDSIEGDKCVSRYLRLTPEEYELVLRDDNVPQYVGKEAPNFGGQSREMDVNACGSGRTSFCISPDGDLNICTAFHKSFGNLKKITVRQALESQQYQQWQKITLSDYEECGRHDYCAYCNLCPGHGHSEHGDFRKASEICCFVAKIRFNLARKMMDGYDPCDGKTLDEAIASRPDYQKVQLHRISEKQN